MMKIGKFPGGIATMRGKPHNAAVQQYRQLPQLQWKALE
jgi:hypothetical protein